MELFLAIALFGVLGSTTCTGDFYVAAPSTLRLNNDATVGIVVEGDSEARVDIYIQDYPGKGKNITHMDDVVQPGKPAIFKLRLDPKDFPEEFLTSPGSRKFVSLNVCFLDEHKEIVIPISSQSGYMFIQSDKPIYTPKQRASFRMISLTEDGLPSKDPFQLQIRNPDGYIMEEKTFKGNSLKLGQAFPSHVYEFPKYPRLGQWSATVRFGHNLEQNSTVRFVLREYVLPTFIVSLETPEVILPHHETISVQVNARYVYRKRVKGTVSFRLGVKSEHSDRTVYFAVYSSKQLDRGRYTLRISVDHLKRRKDIGWFPGIDRSRLVVEATVVDYATGNKEGATDSKAIFSTSPYLISFKRSLRDFKPGLASVFEADIYHMDGRPAGGVWTELTVVADDGQIIDQSRTRTKEKGRVVFDIHPQSHHKTLRLTLRTDDQQYREYQAESTFEKHAFVSPSNAYIAISRSSSTGYEPEDYFVKDVLFQPAELENIYYLVMARGKILQMKKMGSVGIFQYRIEIRVTHDMIPDFRVLVFAHHGEELIADSLKVEVKNECPKEAQVEIDLEFPDEEPGTNGKIIVRGTKDTIVGLLGVDKAVYALSTNDLLTKEKMFSRLSSHDLGCGPGGGMNVDAVLGNAGISLLTNKYTLSRPHSCDEIKRKRRDVANETMENNIAKDEECCVLGLDSDQYGRTCEQRKQFVVEELDEIYSNCSQAFLDCCLNGKRTTPPPRAMGRSDRPSHDKADSYVPEEENTYENVRSDFKETWIFKSFKIGPDNREETSLSLPHSITTWVVQAVSVSPQHGICVSQNKTLVSFKKLFLHLNLPYSVVRNEQIEIQATVFNYGTKEVKAEVEMSGSEDLCSSSQKGEKAERRVVMVGGESAASVAFPVVPLGEGYLDVTVAVYSLYGSDKIRKQLYVRPQGITKEIDIPIQLDPTNQQRRKKRHVRTAQYSDQVLVNENEQTTYVTLSIPEKYIPGTESCSVMAVGDVCGPVVSTAIENPEGLLKKPKGCGEQNMMRLAPTLYTMRYLKLTGRLTADTEEKGYTYIRSGYANQLSYKKSDGSYAAFLDKPSSTWLTAFVMKVFCQATSLVHIDESVICSGVQWLIQNQEPDGSYVEKNPMYAVRMMGGVKGSTPMTAFTLIALEECKCNESGLRIAKTRSVAYLETHLDDVNTSLPVAIVAYALALSGSVMKHAAYDKLQALSTYDEDNNWMYWSTENSAQDIETAGYGLLTQLLFQEMSKSNAIVNWLNTKRLQSGSYKSTQDTVVALQALSEYAIRSQMPPVHLVTNMYLSNDQSFHEVLTFNNENTLIVQNIKIGNIGGDLIINTTGYGIGSLVVKLRYNVMLPDVCKFDLTVNVTDAESVNYGVGLIDPRRGAPFPEERIANTRKRLDNPPDLDNSRMRTPERVKLRSRGSRRRAPRATRQRQNKNNKVKLNITLCVRYLGNEDAGMSIVDVGIFSGFEPDVDELQQLASDERHLISLFEQSTRGVVFYLDRVPRAESYCFSFRVIQKYLVGKTQSSAIKVYDYYNPDATCTQFYSPLRSSPLLKTICQGFVCQCAEGGCPPERPFQEFAAVPLFDKRDWLTNTLCEKYDYVWKGRLNNRLIRRNGMIHVLFDVEEVIKEGIEAEDDVKETTKTLMLREDCETTKFLEGTTYMIMGKDGQAYEDEDGEIRQRYLLDSTSVVYQWINRNEADPGDRQLISFLNSMSKRHLENKCK